MFKADCFPRESKCRWICEVLRILVTESYTVEIHFERISEEMCVFLYETQRGLSLVFTNYLKGSYTASFSIGVHGTATP